MLLHGSVNITRPVFCCAFRQIIRSLSNPQKYENSPRVHLSRHGLFDQVRKSISDRKDKITDLLEENCTQLSEKGEVITY